MDDKVKAEQKIVVIAFIREMLVCPWYLNSGTQFW